MIKFLEYHKHKGHVFGECLSHPDSDLMYVYIPKNASSWTKPNFQDWNWDYYNYHVDNLYCKHAIIVLRDPIDRWLSGIAEYMFLYHRNADSAHFSKCFFDLVFDKITFDDHTEQQILFLEKLDYTNCTFFWCDNQYRQKFSHFLQSNNMPNRYYNYEYQHVTDNEPNRSKFKKIFKRTLYENSKYLNNLQQHFNEDYKFINSIKFYAG